MVQLAWAVRDLHAAIARCGLAGRLEELAAGAEDPAAYYAWGLLRLAGEKGKRLELEDRVRELWADPTAWQEVASWFRILPTLMAPPVSGSAVEKAVERQEPDRKTAAETRQSVQSPYHTAEEAAEYLRTTVQGVYSLRKRGLLHPLPGSTGRLRFTREALDRCMQTRRRGR